jgi:hypothetical protein
MVFIRVCPTSPVCSNNPLTSQIVSDVFHTGSPESTLWEFKHGNGNFKRGDLAGLREIKRRASRHALINRESFSSPHKASVSNPGTPAEPMPEIGGDPGGRLLMIEHSLSHMYDRLVHTEENNLALSQKCLMLSDSLTKCHQVSRQHFPISTPALTNTTSGPSVSPP